MLTLSEPMRSLWVGECKLSLLLAGLTWSKPAVLPSCFLMSRRVAGRGEEVSMSLVPSLPMPGSTSLLRVMLNLVPTVVPVRTRSRRQM